MKDERIAYWTEEWPSRNFGDYISEYFQRTMFLAPLVQADRYRLIGSVIDEHVLQGDLDACDAPDARIALWCCGKRDDRALSSGVRDRCIFLGARGPLTVAALGLSSDTPIGDPALLLPLLYTPKGAQAGGTICVPHYHEPRGAQELAAESGADLLLSPAVDSIEALEALIEKIATADFVLAGALHAAIVAAAYGRPFAYWNTGHVDVPIKWDDFALSLGIDMPRVQTVEEGREVYRIRSARIRLPSASGILGCCPFAVRPQILIRALGQEAGLPACDVEKLAVLAEKGLLQQAGDGLFDRPASDLRRAEKDAAWRLQRMDSIVDGLGHTLEWIASEAHAARFRFASEREMKMSAGSAGAAFLGDGWSSPNEIGPWSEGEHSIVELPPTTGWAEAAVLMATGYVFVPDTGDRAPQTIAVRLNDIPVAMETVEVVEGSHTRPINFMIPVPTKLRKRGGVLTMTFSYGRPISLRAAGVGSDERFIAMALVSLSLAEGKEGWTP
ncbi:hypothetical protein HL653_07320 [Sphingomonas sp. AP4-R1]|uniref:hypothetical protein n=1 Tax=Sphingomonas sp. AP4-R1 TaxID=2735134 RepID=UPI0014933B52|nr:hypothetical protein [Sphingomonas sp. AP4-R1]QJU57624.1 hypothetical protein HL653_07320 [Sphingomonas sp. AP4-R1]